MKELVIAIKRILKAAERKEEEGSKRSLCF